MLHVCQEEYLPFPELFQPGHKDGMTESAPAGAVGCHRKTGTLQAFVESFVIILSPHRYNTARFEGTPHVLDGTAAVERITLRVTLCMRSAIQVEHDGVETGFSDVNGASADQACNVSDFHGYTRISDCISCQNRQRSPAPVDDGRVQFGHNDPR